jgi:hypothetical protein
MFGVMNTIPKYMFENNLEIVEQMFQMQVDLHNLKISDAERAVKYVVCIESESNKPPIYFDSNYDKATHVELMYRWNNA